MEQGRGKSHENSELQGELIVLNPLDLQVVIPLVHLDGHTFKSFDYLFICLRCTAIHQLDVGFESCKLSRAPGRPGISAVLQNVFINLLDVVAQVPKGLMKVVAPRKNRVGDADVGKRRREIQKCRSDRCHIDLLEQAVRLLQSRFQRVIFLGHWERLLLVGEKDGAHFFL